MLRFGSNNNPNATRLNKTLPPLKFKLQLVRGALKRELQ
jgi:hypothetical protein